MSIMHRAVRKTLCPSPTTRFHPIVRSVMAACAIGAAGPWLRAGEAVELTELESYRFEHGVPTQKGSGVINRSLRGAPLTIAGAIHDRGLGSHAPGSIWVAVNGAERFTAQVGVDDGSGTARSSVTFQAVVDGVVRFDSGLMHRGDAAKMVDIDLRGAKSLHLVLGDGGDGNTGDLADWAEARFTVSGTRPQSSYGPVEDPIILTPPSPVEPRVRGARVMGVRPGHPLLFTIPTTGERPMRFSATGLPDGVTLDPDTGRLGGTAPTTTGTYPVTITASNARGEDRATLRLIIGEAIALTPPMGWSTWYSHGPYPNQQKVAAAAKAMVDTGLINHGWTYINIDDGWQGSRGGPLKAIQGNAKTFPDLPGLSRTVHDLGLKLGIYSTPWVGSYLGRTGSSADDEDGTVTKSEHRTGRVSFAAADAQQWALWGIDFMKYDWSPIDVPNTTEMSQALRVCGRDIVYGLSNGASLEHADSYVKLAHTWRTTGDIQAYWKSVSRIGFTNQLAWTSFAGPGHWNDPDILQVGMLNDWHKPGQIRTGLTVNEQYSQVSLWCLLAAPLIIGGDLTRLDAFTLGLLTNDEVLAVDQDPLGKAAVPVVTKAASQVWMRPLEDGTMAVGLFNLDESPAVVEVPWTAIGAAGSLPVRDLWRQQDLGSFAERFSCTVPRHGVVMIRVGVANGPRRSP